MFKAFLRTRSRVRWVERYQEQPLEGTRLAYILMNRVVLARYIITRTNKFFLYRYQYLFVCALCCLLLCSHDDRLATVVDEMGVASAKVSYIVTVRLHSDTYPQAQGLRLPITTYQKLVISQHILYIMSDSKGQRSVRTYVYCKVKGYIHVSVQRFCGRYSKAGTQTTLPHCELLPPPPSFPVTHIFEDYCD